MSSGKILNDQEKRRLGDIFNEMNYSPNTESYDVANEWLKKQNYCLGNFIGGEWIFKSDRPTLAVEIAQISGIACNIQYADNESCELAIESSSVAYHSWRILGGHVRAQYLYNVARNIQKHSTLFSMLESISSGKSLSKAKEHDVAALIRGFYHSAGCATMYSVEMKNWSPIGVVLISAIDNSSLTTLLWRLCSAFASGNAVILNIGLRNCLSALLLAEICGISGIPPGIINVVIGSENIKPFFGKISKCVYSGSLETGKKMAEQAALLQTEFDLHIEGKHTVLVLENADIHSAVSSILESLFCSNLKNLGCKVLIQDCIKNDFLFKMKEAFDKLLVNHPFPRVGSWRQVPLNELCKLNDCINEAKDQGCKVFHDESELYPPTLVFDIQTSSRLFNEEVCGPVITVVPVRTVKESISVCNQNRFCSSVSVWTEKLSVALEVAHQLKACTVWINCQDERDANASFDHSSLCANAYENGKQGIYSFLKPSWQKTTKSVFLDAFPSDYGKSQSISPCVTMIKTGNNSQMEGALVDRTFELYYGGNQKRSERSLSRPIYDTKDAVFCYVSEGSGKDICNAIESANLAYDKWSKVNAHNRAQMLYYIAENLDARKGEFSSDLQRLTGSSCEECADELDISIQRLFYWAAYCVNYGGDVKVTSMYGEVIEVHESLGVVGIICPEKKPLLSFVSLFAPAIARGNTVVVVPSETCPVLALKMHQVFDASDIPAGVINLVSGNRDHLTRHLCQHMIVEALWFHADCEKGKCFVRESAVRNLKKIWIGQNRNWSDPEQGQGFEFLFHAIRSKFIWMPIGDIFAN